MEKDRNRNCCLEVRFEKRWKKFAMSVDFTVEKGVWGILGASGCGKSMTLKSIAGIVTPDSGRIVLHEEEQDQLFYDSEKNKNLCPQKRRVGYLFQSYALFSHMTVEQNIMTGIEGSMAGGKKLSRQSKYQKLEEMVGRFRLEGLEQRYPRQLSGGQQQRVALARILAYKPRVLLLDEPFSAMDSYLRERLRLELAQIMREYEGIAILVTHDRDEAYQLCDQLMLMEQGQILASGSSRELFLDPEIVQVARLTGCKNISRIDRLASHRFRALDWGGLELMTKETIGEEIGFVGIRAHDFQAVGENELERWRNREDGNLISTGTAVVSELPFEWYITLENGLWWKREKDRCSHGRSCQVPQWLRVDASAILLLKKDDIKQ